MTVGRVVYADTLEKTMASELNRIDQDDARFLHNTQNGSQCKMYILLTYENFHLMCPYGG